MYNTAVIISGVTEGECGVACGCINSLLLLL